MIIYIYICILYITIVHWIYNKLTTGGTTLYPKFSQGVIQQPRNLQYSLGNNQPYRTMAVVCPSLNVMIRHCVFEGALFFPAATPYWGHESHDPTGLGILVEFLQKLVQSPICFIASKVTAGNQR